MIYNTHEDCKIENPLEINSLFTIFKQKFASDYLYKGEVHDFAEAVFILEGKVGVTAGKNVHMLEKGQMIFHPLDEFHNIWSAEGTPEVFIVTFTAAKNISGVFSYSEDDLNIIETLYSTAADAFLFNGIWVTGIKDGGELKAEIFKKGLEFLFLKIISGGRKKRQEILSAGAANYNKIVSAMQENVNLNLTCLQLAEKLALSVSSLEKTVRKYAGAGAMELFLKMKIKRAKELLGEGKSVKETAFTLGFSSPYYFSYAFSRQTGMPPSKWKD